MKLIATAMFGLEATVKRELIELGYQPTITQPGSVAFEADLLGMCRANIRLRTAERILICLGQFPAEDFDQLFEQTKALPWSEWIPADGMFPVRGKSVKSQLSSVPACQRSVKKAIVEHLFQAHGVSELPESGATYPIEVALLSNTATLTLDTTGPGLHKRGYRPLTGAAPLRETLAAALVMLSFWKADRPLIDPFCGTGTIPIEAARLARNMAPGLEREFGAESWPSFASTPWAEAREEAADLIDRQVELQILGTDVDPRPLKMARQHAEAAGVAGDIHFQQKSFQDLTSRRKYGCVVTNPPYGHRLSNPDEVAMLYEQLPLVLRHLPTWSHFILTAFPNFEQVIGQAADRRRKLYNGRIECQYYQFHGPRPPRTTKVDDTDRKSAGIPDADTSSTSCDEPKEHTAQDVNSVPVFGGLHESTDRQVTEFRNRLLKRARHLRKWPRRGITCYRLYERDVPGIPLIVDRYEEHLHIAELLRPHERTPAEHAEWLELMLATATDALEVKRENVHLKARSRQRGSSQYERLGAGGEMLTVQEGGLSFLVNLTDYLDTGLFLDHRITRQMVRDAASGRRMLNLFGYTGSFSVYAAAGGATETVTVDRSANYLEWARSNLRVNNLDAPQHRRVRADALDYLASLERADQFDLVVVDPPTFSNSKDQERDWDVQQDHVELLQAVAEHLSAEGVIFFSTNFRRFKLAEQELPELSFREISKQTVPEDFRNRRIHRCWQARHESLQPRK